MSQHHRLTDLVRKAMGTEQGRASIADACATLLTLRKQLAKIEAIDPEKVVLNA